MSHYFKTDDRFDKEYKELSYSHGDISLQISTKRGIFSKGRVDFGTDLLIKSIDLNDKQKKVIDVGCGYGIIGLYLAKKYLDKEIIMVDINRSAVLAARENASLNDIKNVDIKHNDLLNGIDVKADVVVTNPPIRAGKDIVFKIYEQSYERLNDGGVLYVVIQRKQGAPSSIKRLEELFKSVEIITKKSGYFIIKAKK